VDNLFTHHPFCLNPEFAKKIPGPEVSGPGMPFSTLGANHPTLNPRKDSDFWFTQVGLLASLPF
jgi:hypothetical protein